MCIGTDANSHHTAWGSTNINERGERLLEFLVRTNLVICNRGVVPTFRTAVRLEVLDLTLISNNLSWMVGNWRVAEGISLSDHELIRWELGEIGIRRQKTRNIRKTDWKKYVEDVLPRLGRIPTQNVVSVEELDLYTEKVTQAILISFKRSCRESSGRGGKGGPAWTPDLKELQRQARRAQRRAYNTGNPEDWERKRECQREFKRALRGFQQSSWRQYCTEMEGLTPVARLVKLLKQDSMVQIGMLQKEDGGYTSTPEEALDLLLAEHFPDADVEGDSQIDMWAERGPLPAAEVEHIITRRKIECALQALEPFKAPGLDGLYPVLLQRAERALLPHLLGIFRASLRIGCVPRLWRETRVAFIPKPGKERYDRPSAFRPVSLSSFMLKVMEKVVKQHLELEGKIVLNEHQHAYRTGRSTETALHQLVVRIEDAYYKGKFALAVMYDVEGAFSDTSFQALDEGMRDFEMHWGVRRWILDMLVGRRVLVNVKGCEREREASRGCPQGGVLSPTLWNMMMDGHLREMQETYKEAHCQAYADDGALLFVGWDPGVLRARAQLALRTVQHWARSKGLRINAAKTESIMFTRRRKWLMNPLTLDGVGIPLKEEVKYLGVILDRHLTWRAHCEWKAKACARILMSCRRIVGNSWGIRPQI